MSSETVQGWRDLKQAHRAEREALGQPCPMCRVKQPRRTPTLLLPAQRCRVDGYIDPRPYQERIAWAERNSAIPATNEAAPAPAPPYPFCRHPAKCTPVGRCTAETCCAD